MLGAGGAQSNNAYGFKFFTPTNVISKSDIRTFLLDNKQVPITLDSNNIEQILKSYKSTISKDESLKLDNFDVDGKEANKTLVEKCNWILDNEESDNKISLKKAQKWCVEKSNKNIKKDKQKRRKRKQSKTRNSKNQKLILRRF